VLVIQHEAMTPPGLLTAWLAEQSASVDALRIDEDGRLVDPRRYDLVVSLGSELAAYDDSIPWVSREVFFLEDALEADVPVLGLCFGAQMLARVLGADAHRAAKPEIGWVRVKTSEPDLVAEGPWFEWHFDTFTAPPGADVIAHTDVGPQAYVAGRSLGVQFHPEVTAEIVQGWMRGTERQLKAVGVNPQALLDETRRRAAEAKQATWRLLEAFRDVVVLRGR
jgi:GMP synthase (glutamine-hydrolysing)